MSTPAYSLNFEDYTVKNALLWGNFVGHCKKVKGSDWRGRTIHVIIAALEIIPIIGQIISLFEIYMCKYRIPDEDTKKSDNSPASSELENPLLKPVLSKRSITGHSTPPIVIPSREDLERREDQPKEQVIRLKIEIITRNGQPAQSISSPINVSTPIQQKNVTPVPIGVYSILRSESIPATIIRGASPIVEDEKGLASEKPISIKSISVTPDEIVLERTPVLKDSIVLSDIGSVQEGVPIRSKSAPAILSPNVENNQSSKETNEMTSSFISVSEDGVVEGQEKEKT